MADVSKGSIETFNAPNGSFRARPLSRKRPSRHRPPVHASQRRSTPEGLPILTTKDAKPQRNFIKPVRRGSGLTQARHQTATTTRPVTIPNGRGHHGRQQRSPWPTGAAIMATCNGHHPQPEWSPWPTGVVTKAAPYDSLSGRYDSLSIRYGSSMGSSSRAAATPHAKPPFHTWPLPPRPAQGYFTPAASIPRNSFFRSEISSRSRAANSNCRSRAAFIIWSVSCCTRSASSARAMEPTFSLT